MALWTSLLLLVGWTRSFVQAEVPTIIAIPDENDTTTTNNNNDPTILLAGEESKSTTTTTTTTTTISALSFLRDCRNSGFDPMQLACTTCRILPKQHQPNCQKCCQSYKTLENKRSKRYYEMAYLLNTGFPESVQEFVKEDLEMIVETKGSSRFYTNEFHNTDRNNHHNTMMRMTMMGMLNQEPSAIFWFDKRMDFKTLDVEDVIRQADEITVLSGRGLGRDDMRDMLLTLLPDTTTTTTTTTTES